MLEIKIVCINLFCFVCFLLIKRCLFTIKLTIEVPKKCFFLSHCVISTIPEDKVLNVKEMKSISIFFKGNLYSVSLIIYIKRKKNYFKK